MTWQKTLINESQQKAIDQSMQEERRDSLDYFDLSTVNQSHDSKWSIGFDSAHNTSNNAYCLKTIFIDNQYYHC